MGAEEFDLGELDFRVAHLCRLHHSRAHTLLESLDLYHGQPPLLYALWDEEGLSHAELATRIHVKPPTLSRMVQRMKKSGMLLTKDDPVDQRVSRVYLTDAGRAIKDRVHHTWEQLGGEMLTAFTDEERVALRGFLLRMAANLESASGVQPCCDQDETSAHSDEASE